MFCACKPFGGLYASRSVEQRSVIGGCRHETKGSQSHYWEGRYNLFMIVKWTDYLKYKSKLRGFDLAKVEDIVKYSPERYSDTVTGRRVAIGLHENKLL